MVFVYLAWLMWLLGTMPVSEGLRRLRSDAGQDHMAHDMMRNRSSKPGDEHMPQTYSFEWGPCSPIPLHCGSQYFPQVRKFFFKAQSEIIIQGWDLEWDVKMFWDPAKKPTPTESLLDLMLAAADRGVHVYVLLWKTSLSEMWGIPHNLVSSNARNLYVKHPNIHVLLDDTRESGVIYWSAHIKATVFDRSVAFVGGIDYLSENLDSPDHVLPDDRRVPDGTNVGEKGHGYKRPHQDVMIQVSSEQARDIARVAVERWSTLCEYGSYGVRELEACNDINRLKYQPFDSYGKVQVTVVKQIPIQNAHTLTFNIGYERHQQKMNIDYLRRDIYTMDLGYRRDLGKRATVKVDSDVVSLRTLFTDGVMVHEKHDGTTFRFELLEEQTLEGTKTWRQTMKHLNRDVNSPNGHTHQSECRVLLSGNNRYLGASSPIMDIYKESIRMIEQAQASIYIENQYFITWTHDESACDISPDHPKNVIGRALFNKIVHKADAGEDFSVVVLFPLAFQEKETLYPSLLSAACFHRRLSEHWMISAKRGRKLKPLEQYFGMFHLGNMVQGVEETVTHFYGIFIHTKVLIVDVEVEGKSEAIVGSANINDRSLRKQRDAELSMAIKGTAFAQHLLSKLLSSHASRDLRTLIPTPGQLAASLRRIALKNVEVLRHFGINWNEGTLLSSTKLFDQSSSKLPFFGGPEDAAKVGTGEHWARLVKVNRSSKETRNGTIPPCLIGHLLPYSYNIWGNPSQYKFKNHFFRASWLQVNASQHWNSTLEMSDARQRLSPWVA